MSRKPIRPPQAPPATATAKTVPGKVARGVSPHADAAAATALARDSLARDRYEFLLKSIYLLIAALAISVVANVYLGTRPVQFRYFTTDPQGGIREILALNRPVQGVEEVLNWTTQVVTKSYSLSFANYAQQLDDLKNDYTDGGWLGYQQALTRAGFIDSLLNNQYVTSAVPQKAPVVVAEGLVNGVYGWRLQVPIIVTFQSASSQASQTINVEVTVVRRPETENPKGLGIAQIVSQ